MAKRAIPESDELPRRRWWLKPLMGLTLVGAVLVAAFLTYRRIEPVRLTNRARAYFEKGDVKNAMIAARQAIQIRPSYWPAYALVADLREKAGASDALLWRKQALEFAPDSVDAIVAYAACALQFREHDLARATLASVKEGDRQRADYQAAAGLLAFRDGDSAQSVRRFEEALRLEPENMERRFSLAQAQLGASNEAIRRQGRATLEDLANDARFGMPALRTLLGHDRTAKDFASALRVSRKLCRLPGHVLRDELSQLELLHQTDPTEFSNALAALQTESVGDGHDAGAVLVWMSREGMATEAAEWVAQRAPELAAMNETQPALAGCFLVLHDWPKLLAATKSEPWPLIDYARHAYRARALRETGELFEARSEWKAATDVAAENRAALAWLARMTTNWEWTEEMERVLWTAVERTPNPRWALESLYRHYFKKKDTEGVQRATARLIEEDPGNTSVLNDYALASLLMKVDVDRAARFAQVNYEKDPMNPSFASTHAFALLRRDQIAEALRVLEALPAAKLETPSVAGYYGLVLAANRDNPEKVRRFLELGQKAALLPEEARLISVALQESPP
jgi:tetratricopeptide (TPR) repeat protein